jgi:2-polyprenyl-6-hydroxyphenyl methylase/3-demethylubiquinone-9 3-methyltransferase
VALSHSHEQEVAAGERFEFGRNWSQFLSDLDEERVRIAEDSLKLLLGASTLEGKTFLDVGSGSGLFSLAARRLGARVRSLDYDPQSVACTQELRRRYFTDDDSWQVEQGSALDPEFLRTLGTYDVVYSWGVLHHTGAMWTALGNMVPLVRLGGQLAVAIYNDQGTASRRWTALQRLYNRLPSGLRFTVLLPSLFLLWTRPCVKDLIALRPFRTWRDYAKNRGMSAWHDLVDWVGGYPREVAKPEEVFTFYKNHGFELTYLNTQGGSMGCNEFTFTRRR